MNEEYNNNQTGENNSSYDYLNQNQGTQNNPYTIYPTPILKEEKPKKRGKLLRGLLLIGAGAAFGLIAAVTFQGYYYFTRPSVEEGTAKDSDEESNLQLTEVESNTQSEDAIIPTELSEDAVVTDVSDVVAKVMPSIVAINSSTTVSSYDIFGRQYSESVSGSGSGIIIGQNGTKLLIVTNNHVIEGSDEAEIVFVDDSTAPAVVKGADANADLAVLSVDLEALSEETIAAIKVATLGNSDEVLPGDMSIAIGNALGYGQSTTVGYISAVNRDVSIENQTMTLLQTDAAINPGNSGGALINSHGQVIGINSVKYASEDVEGMGYAIPISNAIPMINELMSREELSDTEKGFLGINVSTAQEVTQVYADRFNMPIGIYINDVVEDSPAEAAGLKQGDIITGLDGVTVKTIDELTNALSYKKEGQTIGLKIQVKEKGIYTERTLTITLGKRY